MKYQRHQISSIHVPLARKPAAEPVAAPPVVESEPAAEVEVEVEVEVEAEANVIEDEDHGDEG
jgi:hypothetical protein